VPSTSGRVAAYSKAQKLAIWSDLGAFIMQERERRSKRDALA